MNANYNDIGHYRAIVRETETKLDNAWSALREHERRKKPCEKCAMADESGYSKGWHCTYYHTVWTRIEARKDDLSRAKAALRSAEQAA